MERRDSGVEGMFNPVPEPARGEVIRAFIGEGSIRVGYIVSALTPHGAVLEGGPLLPLEADVEVTISVPRQPPVRSRARVVHTGRDANGNQRLMLLLQDLHHRLDDPMHDALLDEAQRRQPAA